MARTVAGRAMRLRNPAVSRPAPVQRLVMPPSMISSLPTMKRDSSEAK